VELVGVLLDSLASLGKAGVPETVSDDNLMDPAIRNELRDMKRTASAISERAATLQLWIWTLLQRVNSPETHGAVIHAASLEGQVAALKGQCRVLEARIAELATTRDEAINSDRRVRRGLYRLASGRMKLEEVLKAVEDDDNDGSAAIMAMQVAEKVSSNEIAAATAAGDGEGEVVDGAHVMQLKKQLQDLEEIASSRESQIEQVCRHHRSSCWLYTEFSFVFSYIFISLVTLQLLKNSEESSKRINSLSLPKSTEPADIAEDDVKRSSLYTETATKLVTAERQLAELKTRMNNILEKYATAKADTELATKCLEDHMEKFKKRWAELTGTDEDDLGELYDDDEQNNDSDDKDKDAPLTDSVAQAKRIVELEHKLKQALESVRQADTVRVSLREAQLMNETLQQKLEEFKTKNAALMAGRTASRSTSESALSVASKEKASSVSSSASLSAEKAERLQKEYKKMKKELASAVASKEGAKAKQDVSVLKDYEYRSLSLELISFVTSLQRAEKERDNLIKTNMRLLKQSTEKDDMNAKSLSTILHLKSLTEQYEQEKVVREQEAKSVEQVSLAARLAANAKERVTEEVLKEKKVSGLLRFWNLSFIFYSMTYASSCGDSVLSALGRQVGRTRKGV
jgi:E3 ubiquitin-protein ligase BRE1